MSEQERSITEIMDDFYETVKEAPTVDAYAALMRRAGLVSDREAIEALARLVVALAMRVRFLPDNARGVPDYPPPQPRICRA